MLNQQMEKELDNGNIEYKLKLINKNTERIKKLATQMRYRVNEGNGEAIYHIGVSDSGEIIGINSEEFEETFIYLKKAAEENNYNICLLSKKLVCNYNYIFELLIREINDDKYINIKVAVAGSVDSGKSTTIGLLTTGVLDDGRGSTRISVFNYKHELISGRTSSIAHHILGFDKYGKITNYSKFGKPSWCDIVSRSQKIISFLDLCGHEKYLKTTITGLSSSRPDICFILVGANMGITNITKEHICLCVLLNIPFIIIITKIDICKNRQNILNDTRKSINLFLKSQNIRRIPYKIRNIDDIILCCDKIYTQTYTPIFYTSNLTGEGINLLKKFLNILPNKKRKKNKNSDVEMYIDSIFKVNGVGTVIGGHLLGGTINVGDKLLLGPIQHNFNEIIVRSIHCKRVPLISVTCGKYVCIGVKKIDRNKIRKGQFITSVKLYAVKEFDAEIYVLKTNHTTIKVGYQPVIHCGSIRQSVNILNIKKITDARKNTEDKILRTGDRAIIRFKFLYHPEYIKKNVKIFLTEGKIKIIGIVKNTY